MKRSYLGLSKNNKGSTLLLVMITIAFIAILGYLSISMTMTNIQMKAVDAQSKENFYKADGVITEIKASLGEIGTKALEESYKKVLQNYADINNNPGTVLRDELDREFLEQLMIRLTTSGTVDGTAYDVDKIKVHMREEYKTASIGIMNINGDPGLYPNLIELSYDAADTDIERCVKIKGLKVKYLNANNDQETTITTDIVIYAPELEFSASSDYPEFSKYTIIADKQLKTDAASELFTIAGSIYAGVDGVTSTAGNLTIVGDNLITRGNVSVSNGAALNIGTSTKWTNIWTENIATDKVSGSSLEAVMNIYGNCNVSNDLILNAKNSRVMIGGNYYGYNFNKKNIPVVDETSFQDNVDSEYSSAILVNGIGSSLDLSTLNKLQVVGRAFVSRENEMLPGGLLPTDSDILMGQSVAVKSNQTAYLVQSNMLKVGHNPISRAEFTGPNLVDEVDMGNVPDSIKNLLSDRKIAVYCYSFNGIELIYYYWDFKDQQSANTYFLNYYSEEENKSVLDQQSLPYVAEEGIKLRANLYLLGSNILSVDPATGESRIVGEASLINPDNPTEEIRQDSVRRAMEYKARQLSLLMSAPGVTAEDCRLLDKNTSPLFESLITQDAGASVISNEAQSTDSMLYGFNSDKIKILELDLNADTAPDCSVVIVDNSQAYDNIFRTSTVNPIGFDRKGMIVATGDVILDSNFEGIIISGGRVETQGGFTISGNIELVREILKYGIDHFSADQSTNYIHYFTQYRSGGAIRTGTVGTADISSLISFRNWKKNAE